MTITAKWPETCTECHGAVKPGELIEWDRNAAKGKQVRHTKCAAAKTPEINRPKTFAPTEEQLGALALFGTGKNIAIEAGAGAGKTSTLILLAQSTTRRGQYVAFNKAIVQEAGSKMPGTVTCSTAHSLAFRAVGHQYRDRLQKSRRMRSIDIATRLGIESINVTVGDTPKTLGLPYLGGLVMSAVTRFCQSADMEPGVHHVPYIDGIDELRDGQRTYGNNNYVRNYLLSFVRAAWADLMKQDGVLPFKHDHYLKAWHLSGPRISADYILFDECQDANPVMLAIIEAQQHAQRVYVGDSQQAIYGFTGAVNALDRIREQGGETAYLTQSFRFGPAVAAVANKVLEQIESATLRLVGTDSIASVVGPAALPDAILTRTNATAVRTVMRLQEEGKIAALVGGGDDVVAFARAAADLMEGRPTEHHELACFTSWDEVRSYVTEDEQGAELRLLVKLVDDFSVPAILAALGRTIREDDADVIVSTAHKSKGREWGSVQLGGDFPPASKMHTDELRLLYVAVTRAKRELDVDAVDPGCFDPSLVKKEAR